MDHSLSLVEVLQRPVPDQAVALQRKEGYRSYPLLEGQLNDSDPLVDVSEYGIAGRSYYSRVSVALEQPIKEVDPPIMVRQSLAEKLADINLYLQQSTEVTKLLGGQVELYIQEGFRSTAVQKKLYGEIFPQLIRHQQPGLTEEQIRHRRDQLVARPGGPGNSPSPHTTGAAIDITLRFTNPDLDYKQRNLLQMGHEGGATTGTALPDYFEGLSKLTPTQLKARRNRRAFYWVMRGALTPGGDSGLVCNPTEWWHWSYGDQMWAALTQAPYAFYGSTENR